MTCPRITSPISYVNLATDLQVDPKTVQAWTLLLENFYVLFKVTPYRHNIARSILKEPKSYFFDTPRAKGIGARLKNLVACALLKAVHYFEDTEGHKARLHYLKTRDGKEFDTEEGIQVRDLAPFLAGFSLTDYIE